MAEPFLFVACDGPHGRVSKNGIQKRKTARRHVQLKHLPLDSNRIVAPLPLQIKFRTSEKCTCGISNATSCICRKRQAMIARGPIATSDVRADQLIHCINQLCLDSTPIVFLPSRLGRSAVLDLSADALIHLLKGSIQVKGSEVVVSGMAVRCYTDCLALIRKSIARSGTHTSLDELMGAASLLGVFDVVARDALRTKDESVVECFTHWTGISAMLLSNGSSTASSEVARSSMMLAGCSTFAIPCYQGVPSPFEKSEWLDAEPASLHAVTAQVQSLSRIAHQLFIHLPRLVALVRKLKRTAESAWEEESEAADLVERLMRFEDTAAEECLLSQIKIVKTHGTAASIRLIPSSFEFPGPRDMTAAVLYWQARLILLGLCAIVHSRVQRRLPINQTAMAAERDCATHNILMSHQYAVASGHCATAPLSMGLVAVWSACRNKPFHNGQRIGILGDWIVDTLDKCQGGWSLGRDRADLDMTAGVLTGEPLQGRLAGIVAAFA